MERRESEPPDRVAMVASCVALVVLPAVPRIARGEPGHHPVADDLGDDRGAGHGVNARVAVDHVRVLPDLLLETYDPVTVDDDVLMAAQTRDRAAHREMRGVVDVELVDLA